MSAPVSTALVTLGLGADRHGFVTFGAQVAIGDQFDRSAVVS